MTATEQKLWRALRRLGVNFRRQAPIGRYFADFATHSAKLVIEIDGGVHERLPSVAMRDVERQRWLEGEGYNALRFTDRQVSDDLDACVERVTAALGLVAAEPNAAFDFTIAATPPSPTLPPSRRKGA